MQLMLMAIKVKIITVADIHRAKKFHALLAKAVTTYRPGVVALSGDFLDASGETRGRLLDEDCAGSLIRIPLRHSKLVGENIPQLAFHPRQNLVKPLQSGALFQVLEPMKGRGRDAQFPRKLGVGRGTLLFPQKSGELPVKSARHARIVPKASFRVWEVLILLLLTFVLLLH
jgi:hypothetical protein